MNAGITDPGGRSWALLLGDWQRVLMLHFEVDAQALQTDTPFDLDLWNGRAFVTLVAFRMENMRLQHLGRFGGWALAPIRSHEFLNVRTYVRCEGTPGISFLAEWVPNPLSCWLGPRLFSLPYRLGSLEYRHVHEQDLALTGTVRDSTTHLEFHYEGRVAPDAAWKRCEPGSLDEWLMERYAAFNCGGGVSMGFRVWHEPWEQRPVDIRRLDLQMLKAHWRWFDDARWIGANYSPGVGNVAMGWPCAVEVPWPVGNKKGGSVVERLESSATT